MNLNPSIPAFSNTLSLPDASKIIPAQVIRVSVSADNDIAVDARTCFVNDSMIVGDLYQSGPTNSIPSVKLLNIWSYEIQRNPS
jgi:hypothetical protein